jgi:hypothetical protein
MVIFGADGYNNNEQNYRNLFDDSSWVANYTSIYGALPVGMMFDITIAAMALCNNEMYPSSLPLPLLCLPNKLSTWKIVNNRQLFNTDCIRCLKLGTDESYAWINVCQCYLCTHLAIMDQGLILESGGSGKLLEAHPDCNNLYALFFKLTGKHLRI